MEASFAIFFGTAGEVAAELSSDPPDLTFTVNKLAYPLTREADSPQFETFSDEPARL